MTIHPGTFFVDQPFAHPGPYRPCGSGCVARMRWAVVVVTCIVTAGFSKTATAGETVHASLKSKMHASGPAERIPVTVVIDAAPDESGFKWNPPQCETGRRPTLEERRCAIAGLKARSEERRGDLLEWLAENGKGSDTDTARAFWIVDAVTASLPPSVIAALEHHPTVRSIYLREPREVLCTTERTAIATDAPPPVWSVTRVGADTVWARHGIDGAGVLVAMLDTGVDYTHSDLQSRMWTNPQEMPNNFIDDDGNGYVDDVYGYDFALRAGDPMDDDGHGTHTAGSVAGDGTGGLVTGVAPGAGIMALKVLEHGMGEEEDAWEAIQYAVENGCDIINMSIGWIQCAHHPARALWRQACENAVAAGVVVLAAAGNERDDEGTSLYCDPPEQIRTPADVPAVIAVGAVSAGDWVSDFSSEGPVTWASVEGYGDYPYPPGLIKPDFCAPGQNINSTLLEGGYSGPTRAGTSMATPHVSGTVALMLQADPSLGVDDIETFLEETCLDFWIPGKDNLFGYGRIHALSAVEAVLAARTTAVAAGERPWRASSDFVCHPNPFNPEIFLEFSLAAPGTVRLAVYDVEGRMVRLLAEGMLPAGGHRFRWDGVDGGGIGASSGVYFCRYECDGMADTRKIILAR